MTQKKGKSKTFESNKKAPMLDQDEITEKHADIKEEEEEKKALIY